MTALHETAYPRLRSQLNAAQLREHYTPTADELAFVRRQTASRPARFGLLVLLKTFQRLGYFPLLSALPERLVAHLAATLGIREVESARQRYEASRLRWQQMACVRRYLGVRAYRDGGHAVLMSALLDAAHRQDRIADLINCGIEALIQARHELPAFGTLVRAAHAARTRVNRDYYQQIYAALGETQRTALVALLVRAPEAAESPWQRLKREPRRPTTGHLREFIGHMRELQALNGGAPALDGVPEAKLQRFVDEASALDSHRLHELQAAKRATLIAAFVRARTAQALDDLAEMLIRQIGKLHQRAREALLDYQQHQQARVEALIGLLGQIAQHWQGDADPQARLQALEALFGRDAPAIQQQCQAYLAFADQNYLPFLLAGYRAQRRIGFDALALLQPQSTSADRGLEQAITFLLRQRSTRAGRLTVASRVNGTLESTLDLSWIPTRWWKAVTGQNQRDPGVESADRRYFELCVFSCVVMELKTGDLFVSGSEQFGDYRRQLLDWPEYQRHIADYGARIGLATDAERFVTDLRQRLTDAIEQLDAGFPDNEAVTLVDGEPVIRRLRRLPEPEHWRLIDQLLRERLPERTIVDILAETEHWLRWTRRFGPLSGFEARLDAPRERYIATTFCYGCYLGPTQTARSMKATDRRQVAYVNQHHVTEHHLSEAIVEVINAYRRFQLPRWWGSGQSASADGTQWAVYEQNLLSEYHIRYGGWGGIGYYHVSDTYIALFSRFITCGVWEAVYILDGLLENRSELRPDTLHADTQGQSECVFGLAHLLAIHLMPRIRNWKDLTLYRPGQALAVQHIGELFSDTVNWALIATHLPDMLRVALSVSQGKIRSSTLLRKLGTYSRKNKLYLAFRELGRVVRTLFLLQYLGDQELRRTITSATNTSEAWNAFIQWVAFGGEGVIRENRRAEQRKIIRYNHLVANLLVFHNVASMTRVLQELINEGYPVTEEVIAHLSPYRTEHINRFGSYELRLDQIPEPLIEDLQLPKIYRYIK